MKIAHILNPINAHNRPELAYIQGITFLSLQKALAYNKEGKVQIYSTQYPEDHKSIPNFVKKLPDLKRSVLDVNPKLNKRKLPLIADILTIAHQELHADYIIYTNIDIAVKPHFYAYVQKKIQEGHDAIVINRRRIAWQKKKAYNLEEDILEYFGAIGKSHPGFDCFVFKKELIQKFILGNICIGISFLETSIIHNIAAFAEKPIYVFDQDITFHLGTEVLVSRRKNPFYWHNRTIYFREIQPQLKKYWSIKKFPYGEHSFLRRSISWTLNPSLFTRNFLELEGKSCWQGLKMRLDELRWRVLQK